MKIQLACFIILLYSVGIFSQSPGEEKERDKNKILILATPHLEHHAKSFAPEHLDSLVETLALWKPDHVAVEVQPSFTLHIQNENPSCYAEVIQYFAQDNIEAGQMVQEDYFESWAEADSLYNQWVYEIKDMKKAKQPHQIIKSALGSYRFYTALLHWKRLNTNQRKLIDLSPEVKSILTDYLTRPDERIQLGVRLADSLDHHEVHQIDDHMDKDIYLKFASQLANELEGTDALLKVKNAAFYATMKDSLQSALAAGELLPFYQYVNSDYYQKRDAQLQWELFLNTSLPSKLDRKRLALWEVRNLNIASNIARLTASYPGKKILVIIGSIHKHFLEKYLKEMMGVKLIQLKGLTSN